MDPAWEKRNVKWNVSFYSGSYNIRNMKGEDLKALETLCNRSDTPLVDMAKYPFFGGDDCHPWTASLTTFAMETFTCDLNMCAPLLAAALKLFNDDHNTSLVEATEENL